MQIGVDKSGLLVGGREESRRIKAAQNRRKKLLRPFPVSARVGLSVHALTELQFLEGPLRRVFFFLGHRGSFSSYVVGRPESGWPRPSLPEYPSHSKLKYNSRKHLLSLTTYKGSRLTPAVLRWLRYEVT